MSAAPQCPLCNTVEILNSSVLEEIVCTMILDLVAGFLSRCDSGVFGINTKRLESDFKDRPWKSQPQT